MSEIHQIGELLRQGAVPSKEEVEHLSELGAFVTAMYGRYLHGTAERSELGSGSATFASSLGARLGAETSTRWEAGLGLSEQLLSSEWGGWWQVASRGFGEGYGGQGFDYERNTLELYDDAPVAQQARVAQAQRPRRGSLFGNRPKVAPGRRPASAPRRGVERTARPERAAGASASAQWVDGGFVELTTLAALEAGGLFVNDQLMADTAPARALTSPGPGGTSTAPRRRGATLDGLFIDDRTPALSSALAWAEAAFGPAGEQAGLAINTQRVDAMTSVGAASPGASIAGGRGGERPVYGFFDSVEGDFLVLGPEEAEAAVARVASTTAAQASGPRPSLFAAPSATTRGPRPSTTSTAPISTSLSRIAASGRPAGQVRPFTAGVFSERPRTLAAPRASSPASARAASATGTTTSSPSVGAPRAIVADRELGRAASGALLAAGGAPLRFASQITYDRGGQARARVQRGGSASPRVSLLDIASPAARASVVAAPGGPTSGPRAAARVGGTAAPMTQLAAASPPRRQALGRGYEQEAPAGTRASWHTAADLGPDLPLGATLTQSELFGLVAASTSSAPQTVLGRNTFVPGIARGRTDLADGAAQTPRSGFATTAFTAAFDGVVWVAPEVAGAAGTLEPTGARATDQRSSVERATDRMPLSAVPQGRAAAMMPASQAFAVAARGATGEAMSRAAFVSMAAGDGAIARPVQAIDATADAPAAAITLMAPASTTFERRVLSHLSSGIVPAAASFASADAASAADPSRAGARALSRTETMALIAGDAGLTGGGATAGRTTAGAISAGLGDPTGRVGAASLGMIGRWLDTGAADTAASVGASTTGFGPGAYASLDTARELLAIVGQTDEAAPAGLGAVSGGPAAARTRTRRADRGALVPRTLRSAPASRQALSQASWAPPQVAPAGIDAPARAPRSFAAALAGDASTARNALRRPVATAREARSVAPLLAMLGRGVDALGAPSRAEASNEPVLSRLIATANAERADVLATDAAWTGPSSLLEAVSRLGASEGRAVMRTLADAGWTSSDLRMLSLGDEGLVDAAVADSAPASRREAITRLEAVVTSARAMIARSGAEIAPLVMTLGDEAPRGLTADVAAAPALSAVRPLSERANAAVLGRNLARIVAGAESLGAPVSSATVGGGLLAAAASAQASGFMPMLSGARSDDYFGTSAPDRKSAGRGYTAGLQDAIGELVSIAQELALTADTPVEAAARQETFRRLVDSKGTIERVAGRDTSSRILAAASSDTELARVLGAVSASERAQAVALARQVAPATLARLEQSLSAPALAQLGLVDEVEGRLGRPVGVDATRLTGASDVARPSLAALLGSADQTLVAQEQLDGGSPVIGAATSEARAASRVSRLGLGGRVGETLRVAAQGPAGARRLLRSIGPRFAAAGEAKMIGRAGRGAGGVAPTDLASAIAPEAMLSGLRSPELNQAIASLASASAMRGEAPGVFATLADSAVDLGAGVSPTERGAPRTRLTARGEAREAARREAVLGRVVSDTSRGGVGGINFFKSDPVHVLMQLVARDGGESVGRALAGPEGGFARRGRAGLLSAMMRGADRREVASLFQQAGASDFAFAWLARVDGTKSGIDLGLGDTRADMGRAFGSRQVTSRVAGESPISGAGLVGPAPAREDRSGLRSLVAHAPTTRTGAARAQHGASAAVRRTDWRFVETGSRTPTPHADLGKLAAAIVSSSQAASRAPLPLIAPAAKAVAQTALRSANTEARPASSEKRSSMASGGGSQGQPSKQTLSEEAMEQLAIEMASRVAQIMGRNKERIGVWQ